MCCTEKIIAMQNLVVLCVLLPTDRSCVIIWDTNSMILITLFYLTLRWFEIMRKKYVHSASLPEFDLFGIIFCMQYLLAHETIGDHN